MQEKMKVEIWSDVMCPFCYIGKRKFETAINAIAQKELIEVEWKSFQLNPGLQYEPGRDNYAYLARLKGQSLEWSEKVHDSITQSAKSLGLDYRFDKARMGNSFDAHRIIQLAKKYRLDDAMEERLFRAYFTEGELISDHDTLTRLAIEAGLPEEEVTLVLATNAFAEEVHQDIAEARRLGTTGVPFFVFNRKYAMVGAQDSLLFKEIIEKTLEEWKTRKLISG